MPVCSLAHLAQHSSGRRGLRPEMVVVPVQHRRPKWPTWDAKMKIGTTFRGRPDVNLFYTRDAVGGLATTGRIEY